MSKRSKKERGRRTSTAVVPDHLGARREYYRSVIAEFTMMSDAFMRNVLKKKVCAREVLRIILQQDVDISEVVVQKDYKNLQGRSAILDCVARAGGRRRKIFNLEVQQEKSGAAPNRARYHSGLIDMNILKPGQEFGALPESSVIFITAEDVLGEGRVIYHVDRTIRESGKQFRDKSHIIYVNSAMTDNTPLGRLMHDFHCRNADEMYNEVLAERVRELKETEEGVEHMCKEMDKIYRAGQKRGEKNGRENLAREVVRNLAGRGMTENEIANVVGIRVGEVEKWLIRS